MNRAIRLRWRFALLVFLFFGGISSSLAQRTSEPSPELRRVDATRQVLRVGTKRSPPFAIKNDDGTWTGISIELWKQLADALNLEYELEELTLDQMLKGLENGELDAAVAAISVTADRHARIDFCHPHFATGLGIAVSARDRNNPWTLVRRVVSSRLLMIAAAMIGIVFVSGLLFWLFEHKNNANMFGGKKSQGIGMGIWWSMTLLLGHKGVVPVSTRGRLLAAFAMLSSIMLLSIVTGVITSVLTVQQLDVGIARASDLHNVRVATVTSSTSAEYLRQRRIQYRGYESPEDAMLAVDANQADAVVYDLALLKYLANTEYLNRVDVLAVTFNMQEYAIALAPASELRKPLNEELLRYRESDAWDDLTFRYLGE